MVKPPSFGLDQEEFLGKLKGIKGISMVETQTYTLEEANHENGVTWVTGWPQGVWCSRGGGGNSLGEALRIPVGNQTERLGESPPFP